MTLSMDEQPYRVDLESVERAFPPGRPVPPLLRDVAAWLARRPWGSVGRFALVGSRSDDAPIVDGAPLRDEFALFLRMPDGSVGGFWYDDRRNSDGRTGDAPIAMLGSEGETEIVADSLAAFFARIALRDFSAFSPWGDFPANDHTFEQADDAIDATPQLAAWLRERLGVASLEPLLAPDPARPEFAERMRGWNETRENYWATHPAMHELAAALAGYAPQDSQPWRHTGFRCRIDGSDRFEAIVYRNGPTPIPEASTIEPIVRRLRDAMAHELPRLRPWEELGLRMGAGGRMLPSFVYPAAT